MTRLMLSSLAYALLVSLGSFAQQTSAPPDAHQGMDARGAMVMGFDQEKTQHHFLLYPDGGAIEISVKDAADVVNRDAIRAHLPHLSTMFTAGEFDAPMLVHDAKNVPGTAVMGARKSAI